MLKANQPTCQTPVSVQSSHSLIALKQREDPRNLTPMAKFDVITQLAALIRAQCSFFSSEFTKSFDKRRGIIIAATVDKHEQLHILSEPLVRPAAADP